MKDYNFLVGMRVRCINNTDQPELRINSIYMVNNVTPNGGVYLDNIVGTNGFFSHRFVPAGFKEYYDACH